MENMKTNADTLRSMTDEELATFIMTDRRNLLEAVCETMTLKNYEDILEGYSEEMKNEVLEWLKEEAKNVR